MKELAVFHTAPSLEGMIMIADRAIAEAPCEATAWLYQGFLSQAGNYPMAARRAAREASQRLTLAPPLSGVFADLGAQIENLSTALDPSRYIRALERSCSEHHRRKVGSLNPSLRALDDEIMAYRKNNSTNMGNHIERFFPDGNNAPPEIRGFLCALHEERTIDFSRVDFERKEAIQALTDRMSKEESAALLGKSLSYRLGGVSATGYHQHLYSLFIEKGVDLAPWPEYRRYFDYLDRARVMNLPAILKEVWEAECRALYDLCRSPTERSLIAESHRLFHVSRLFDFLVGKLEIARLHWNTAANPQAPQQFKDVMENVLPSLREGQTKGTAVSRRKPSLARRAISAVGRWLGFHGASD